MLSCQSRLRFAALLLLCCALISTAWSQLESRSQYSEHEVSSFLEMRLTGKEENVSQYRVQLEIPEMDRIPQRARVLVFLAGSTSVAPIVDVPQYEWLLRLSDGTTEGPFPRDTEVPGVVVPAGFCAPRVTRVDEFREVTIYRLEFDAIQTINVERDGQRSQAQLVVAAGNMSITNEPPSSRKLDVPLAEYDPYLVSMLEPLLLNADELDRMAVVPPPIQGLDRVAAWYEQFTDAASRGPVLVSRLPRGGIYVITAATLRSAGIDPITIDPGRLQFMVEGRELPAMMLPDSRQVFDSTVSFMLYVPEDLSGRKPYIALWLMTAGEGESPKRLSPTLVRAQPLPGESVSGYVRQEIFEPNEYHHGIRPAAPCIRWATVSVPYGGFHEFEFEVASPDPNLPLRVSTWTTVVDPRASSEYSYLLNGVEFLRGTSSTNVVRADTAVVSAGNLVEGRNVVTLQNIESDQSQEQGSVTLQQMYLDVPISTLGLGPNERMVLEIDTPSSPTLQFLRQPWMQKPGYLFDVSSPEEPVVYQMSPSRSGNADSFSIVASINSPETPILYASMDVAMVLPSLSRVEPPAFFTATRPVDYLMISHPDFLRELRRLANYRATMYQVETLSTDDIYNVFSYGEMSPHAIRNAIRHVYATRDGARLQRLLLVGEGSEFWWEYRMKREEIARNFLPIWGWQDPDDRVRGDERYAHLADNENIPDLEIGRISINTPEELSHVIDKTIGYETDPPAGDWRNRHVFITDDELEFIRVAHDVVDKTFSGKNYPVYIPLQDHIYENYYRGRWRKRSVNMTDEVLAALSAGARTVSYLGHGGPNLWSSERILHIRDLDSVVNEGRSPVLLAGSCDTGWIDYPLDPVKTSLSEYFLKNPRGGAVGCFIPVAGTSSYEHNFLLTGFFDGMMGHSIERFGTACLYAKLSYSLYRTNYFASEQFILMGDPALRLVDQPELENVRVEPDSFLNATGGTTQLSGFAPGIDWGMGNAILLSPEYEVVSEQKFRIRKEQFSQEIQVPAYLPPGTYHLLVTAYGEEINRQFSALLDIPVEDSKIRIAWERLDAAAELDRAGGPVTLRLELYNDSALPVRGASLQIFDTLRNQMLGETSLDLGANSMVRRNFRAPIPDEIRTLDLRVVVPNTEKTDSPDILAQTTILLPVFSEYWRYVSFPVSAIEIFHDTTDSGVTRFQIPLFNLTETPLEGLEAVLKLETGEGATEIAPRESVPLIQPNGQALVTFASENRRFQGEETFVLELYDPARSSDLPLQVEVFALRFRKGPDLEIVPEGTYVETQNPVAGNTVFVKVRVRNAGDAVATGINTNVYINEAWVPENTVTNVVPWWRPEVATRLMPGEEADYRIRWDPENNNFGQMTLYATAISADTVEENLENNKYALRIDVPPSPNLSLDKENVRHSSNFAQPYETIRFTVPVRNASEFDFLREFRLNCYARTSTGERHRIITHRFSQMLAGENATIQFDWLIQPGEYAVEIHLNEDREFLEETHDDNVMRIDFPYVMSERFFRNPDVAWDFGDFPDFGSYKGVRLVPGRWLTIDSRPTALATRLSFEAENLIRGHLGNAFDIDNLWGLRRGELFGQFEEFPEAVKLRFPLSRDDGTTLYDIYISHLGSYRREKNSGRFRYRFEDAGDWQMESRTGFGLLYFQRVETRDDYLDLELEGPGFPSENVFHYILAAPFAGVYESPIVRFEKPMRGYLTAIEDIPERASIDYAVRFGQFDSAGNIAWEPWTEIAKGGLMPTAAEDSTCFQWKATLVGSAKGAPRLRAVSFGTQPLDAELLDTKEFAGTAPTRPDIVGDALRDTSSPAEPIAR